MNRRTFLSLMGAGGATASLSPVLHARADSGRVFSGSPDALGVLHDSTLCIGCRKCEAACQTANNLPMPDHYAVPEKSFDDLSVLDVTRRTDHQRFTVVNKYSVGDGRTIFRKSQCNHCQDPACVSACFVRALVKTESGPVVYKPDLCVGCRYCMVACPFYVPAYDYNNALNPLVYKCTMCAPRLARGLPPACVDVCPGGAMVFGKRAELLTLARKRIIARPDQYTDHIYGETEMGGTNWLYLSPVSHVELGQPVLAKTSAPELTSGALGSVAMVAGIWPVLLGGAYCISKRREKIAEAEKNSAVDKAVAETKKAADAALQAALARAETDKEKAVAGAVKNIREEMAREATAATESREEKT